jgi:hypothetical protein
VASFTPSHSDHLDCLIDEKQAATFVGYTVRSLQNWRYRGGGPPFIKFTNRTVRYRRRDLIAWAEARLVTSTADADQRLS